MSFAKRTAAAVVVGSALLSPKFTEAQAGSQVQVVMPQSGQVQVVRPSGPILKEFSPTSKQIDDASQWKPGTASQIGSDTSKLGADARTLGATGIGAEAAALGSVTSRVGNVFKKKDTALGVTNLLTRETAEDLRSGPVVRVIGTKEAAALILEKLPKIGVITVLCVDPSKPGLKVLGEAAEKNPETAGKPVEIYAQGNSQKPAFSITLEDAENSDILSRTFAPPKTTTPGAKP